MMPSAAAKAARSAGESVIADELTTRSAIRARLPPRPPFDRRSGALPPVLTERSSTKNPSQRRNRPARPLNGQTPIGRERLMMQDMTKGVLAARALALATALVGVTLGPGGVAAATPARARTPGYALAGGGETVASRPPGSGPG